MIGERYWATGITIDSGGRTGMWRVWLDFFDDGFAEAFSTEGRLRCRYEEPDLAAMIDTLAADATRLGIVLGLRTPDGPTVYAACDRDDLQLVANEQAVRLGWEPVYERAVA